MPPSRRPRLLLGAYACQPERGSESYVGWERAVEAARRFDVDAVVHAYAEDVAAIERAVAAAGLGDRLRFHFLPHTAAERALQRLPGGFYPAYRRWHRRAYRLARRLHAARPFDLVHQATLNGFRDPGDLWRLDAPFVWGPVGGTQNVPAAFLGSGGWRMALAERVRTTINGVQLRGRRVRRAADAAAVLLAANSTGQRDLAAVLGRPVPRLLETAVRDVGAPKRWADRAPGPVRVLLAGDVVDRKGVPLAVGMLDRLAADASAPAVRLVVVGDGPAAGRVRGRADVEWRGRIARAELLALYREADALLFPSLRDTSGNVMLEALAAGLPVVYLDHQGAADIGSAACGVPVPVGTPAQAVADLAAAVAGLAADPARYDRLSAGAIARAHELSWRRNSAALAAHYDAALAASGRPADPSPPVSAVGRVAVPV